MSAQCTATYQSVKCRLPQGHTGQHKAGRGDVIRWGGRYSRAALSGKPQAVRDAAKDKAARVRKPRGPRCRICCHPGELKNGVCADRVACAERQPYLFGSEAM